MGKRGPGELVDLKDHFCKGQECPISCSPGCIKVGRRPVWIIKNLHNFSSVSRKYTGDGSRVLGMNVERCQSE